MRKVWRSVFLWYNTVMAGLKSLIRLRKHELDEKRRAVTSLLAMLDNLQREEKRLLDELEAEKKQAEGDMDSLSAFPGYNKRVQAKIKITRLEQTKVMAAVDRAQADLQDAFKEFKTFEITEENRAKRAAAAEKKTEDALMDDIGIEGFRRKGK